MIALKNKSQLVLVDMQEKLASVMPKEVINKITKDVSFYSLSPKN